MKKVLLHAHIFYPELWPQIATCIENCHAIAQDGLHVVASCPESKPDLKTLVDRALEGISHEVHAVPNRGYDIGPFMVYVVNRPDLADYDYVVKIHTKRDCDTFLHFHRITGSDWRNNLLSFCSTPKAMARSFAAFERDARLGMIADRRITSRGGFEYFKEDIALIRSYVTDLGLTPREATFVYGTMFMVRAKLLLPLANRVTLNDFPLTTEKSAHIDQGLTTQLEKLFGAVVSAQGSLVSNGRLPYSLASLDAKCIYLFCRTVRTLHILVDKLRICGNKTQSGF